MVPIPKSLPGDPAPPEPNCLFYDVQVKMQALRFTASRRVCQRSSVRGGPYRWVPAPAMVEGWHLWRSIVMCVRDKEAGAPIAPWQGGPALDPIASISLPAARSGS